MPFTKLSKNYDKLQKIFVQHTWLKALAASMIYEIIENLIGLDKQKRTQS